MFAVATKIPANKPVFLLEKGNRDVFKDMNIIFYKN